MDFIRDYGEKVTWNVGAAFAHDEKVLHFVDALLAKGIPVPINYAFGAVSCLFHGGRIAPESCDLEAVRDVVSDWNSYGIGVRYTFSRYDITEEILYDGYCNEMMKMLNHPNGKNRNGIICSSDLLASYVHEEYPDIEVVSSATKPAIEVGYNADEPEYYNRLFGLYDIVVVNSAMTNNDFLSKLKHPERAELIVNQKCIANCPRAGAHYRLMAEFEQASIREDVEGARQAQERLDRILKACSMAKWETPFNTNYYSIEDVEQAVKSGIRNFKIEGRTVSYVTLLREMAHFMFQDEKILALYTAYMGHEI